MSNKLLFSLLIVGSIETLPQSIATDQTDKEYCAREKRLGYFHPTDSTRRRVILDSVNRLLVGQWQLIDTMAAY